MSELVCSVCGKHGHKSRQAALRAASSIRRQGRAGRELRAYECVSGLWHVTSQRRTRAARSARVRENSTVEVLKVAPRRTFEGKAEKPRTLRVVEVMRPKRPEHTACRICGRRWLSDLSPHGRRCPSCGAIDSVQVGTADRGRHWIRSLAA